MNTTTLEICPIIYGKKTIDRGIVIGKRPYHWTLKKKYSPCWAKIGTAFVSHLSPHKENFTVYVSTFDLEEGKQITIFNKEYQQPAVRKTLKILKKHANAIECKVIKEETITPSTKEIETQDNTMTEEVF